MDSARWKFRVHHAVITGTVSTSRPGEEVSPRNDDCSELFDGTKRSVARVQLVAGSRRHDQRLIVHAKRVGLHLGLVGRGFHRGLERRFELHGDFGNNLERLGGQHRTFWATCAEHQREQAHGRNRGA
jgi:hypothetical protein